MLVEREGPLEALHAVLGSAKGGQGQVVVLSGEAGIGKTSLLRRFVQEARGAKVLWGGSDALITPRPLGPLCDMASAFGSRVRALLEEAAPQDRVFPALLDALQSAREPHVLIFEDVHWADNATLDLIKYLGRRIGFTRAALILSHRSDEVGPGHPLSQVIGDLPAASTRRLALEPLSVAGINELLRATQRDATELHRISAGNPFFVTELLASAGEAAQNIPASVRDAVWARLQRLTPPERELLEAISIAPSGAEDWFAAALLGHEADAAIDACVARGVLVKDTEERYRFRHELARVATLERVSPAAQRALHRRAFAALSGRPSFPLACLVHHAAGAGDGAQVLALAPRAAAEAVKAGAHREAATHLATALTYAGAASADVRAQLNEDWAYEAGLALEVDAAIIAAAGTAVALWRELGRKDKTARSLLRLSRLHWYRGEGPLAQSLADEAVEALAGEAPCPELALAYAVRAQLHMFNDRFDMAIEWSRKAIAMAEALGDVETRVHALNNLGNSLLYSGDESGKACFEECLALALRHGLHEQTDRAYSNYGEYAVLAKDFALAERLLAEGIAFSTRLDLDSAVHNHVGRQAQLRLDQGRLTEAETIAAGAGRTGRGSPIRRCARRRRQRSSSTSWPPVSA